MMEQAAWRVSVNARGPEGVDGAVVAMLLFCSDVGGTISGYAIGHSSVCIQVDVSEWTEQAAQTLVLAKTASVLGEAWTLELTEAC
jgi:hypothetical protein